MPGDHAENTPENDNPPPVTPTNLVTGRTRADERRARRGPSPVKRGVGVLATVVRVITRAAALVLVVHIVFSFFKTYPTNSIVRFVDGLANTLAWGFKDMFDPADARLEVAVNYGIAALAWLIVGSIVAGLIRRSAD